MEFWPMSKLRNRLSLLLIILAFVGSLVAANLRSQGHPSQKGRPDQAAVIDVTQQILDQVSQLRGLPVLRPVKAALQSRQGIERSLIQDLHEKVKPGEFEAATKALIKFGLVPRNFKYRQFLIKVLTEQVAGYYRPKTKNLYLADWLSLDEQRTVMVHELTHALQDQHFDLERFEETPEGEGDVDMAVHALIEGEATAVMMNYMLKPQRLDITSLPIPLTGFFEQLQRMDDHRSQVLFSAPAVIRESLLFPYTYGIGFVQHILKRGSWQRVSEAYAEPPDSTEQIMHPERFLTRDDPVRIHLARLEGLLEKDTIRRTFDINGEFGYYLILAEYLDKEDAKRAADGWDGDQFALYENTKTGNLLLIHLSTWDTEADAREFADAYAERTLLRYRSAKAVHSENPFSRLWKTNEGAVYLERRGSDVLVLEGLNENAMSKLPNLLQALWKSSKTPPRLRGSQKVKNEK